MCQLGDVHDLIKQYKHLFRGEVWRVTAVFQGQVWGIAYKLEDVEMVRAALSHLGLRECSLGGYTFNMEVFYDRCGATVPVLVFIASPDNDLYLGDCELEDTATQVQGSNNVWFYKGSDVVVDFQSRNPCFESSFCSFDVLPISFIQLTQLFDNFSSIDSGGQCFGT